jgi:Methyltransferase domain
MSEGFAAGWLALREPYDAAARSSELLSRLAAWRAGRGLLRVTDLGAGTGSNLRCAAPSLGGAQDWTLVELDPALIAAGHERLAQAEVGWHYRRLDLARDLERLGAESVDLITASALLDLVGEAWLRRLVAWRAAAMPRCTSC